MYVDTLVYVAAVYRGSPGSWHDAGCCNSVKVENGSAVHGGPQEVASGCTCSSDSNTGGDGCRRQGGEQCGGIFVFDILNKIKMSDLEARISDIYHVISCISHSFSGSCCHDKMCGRQT